MAGTLTVDTIQSDSSYASTLNVASKINFTSGMQIGGQDTTFGGMRNRIINGDMRIDQRNAGASFTNSNAAVYGVDRWITYGITSGVFTCQQVTDAPTGFGNSFKLTISTATTANDGGAFPAQKIEASNCTDLMWGTSNAATVTISFWVKASVTGTYNTALLFYGPTTLYYVSTFTVNSANTWEQKTITVTGPTTGGAFSGSLNAAYLALYTVAIGSSGYTTYTTANTWSSTGSIKTSGTVNLGSTLNATLQVTGVQLEKGSAATAFEYRQYGTELALCQRYFCKSFETTTAPANGVANGINTTCAAYNATSAYVSGVYTYPTQMRVVPTVTFYGVNGATGVWDIYKGSWAATTSTVINSSCSTNLNVYVQSTSMTAWQAYLIAGNFTASAEL